MSNHNKSTGKNQKNRCYFDLDDLIGKQGDWVIEMSIESFTITKIKRGLPSFIFLIVISNHTLNCHPVQTPQNFSKMATSFEKKFDVDSISAAQLKAALEVRKPVLLFDVRNPDEQSVSIIAGAIRISETQNPVDVPEFDKFIQSHKNNPDALIVFYCAVGYRSSQAISRLREHFDIQTNAIDKINIKNLHGGIFAWSLHDYPLIKPASRKSTRVIHAYNRFWSGFLEPQQMFVLEAPAH